MAIDYNYLAYTMGYSDEISTYVVVDDFNMRAYFLTVFCGTKRLGDSFRSPEELYSDYTLSIH